MEEAAEILATMPKASETVRAKCEVTPEPTERKVSRKFKAALPSKKEFVLTDVKRQDDALLVTYRRGRNTFQVPVLPSSTNEEFKAAVKRKLDMLD